MRLTAGEIASLAGGEVLAGDPAVEVESFSNDSRALGPRACFVALRAHRDGHDFVDHALEEGAVAALVARPANRRPLPGPGRAVVRVADPARAIAVLAMAVRARLPAAVVGVTGSTGKTSTKDLVLAAVRGVRVAHGNPESYNNEIGLPLTILNAPEAVQVLVTEMGARFPGNVASLCGIARPDVGVVTNVGLAHAEHLGGPEGVAAVKGELLEALPADGLAVLNADDPWTPTLAARTIARVVTVGHANDADLRLRDVTVDDELRASFRLGRQHVQIPLRGAHQVHNAAMAAVVAHHLGVPWDDVSFTLVDGAAPSRWRMELEVSRDGLTVLNDAYNANPDSMEAALRALAHLPVGGRRIAVLGDMRELGEHGAEAHARIGRVVGRLGVDVLVGVGAGGALIADAAAPDVEVHVVDDARAALGLVGAIAAPGDAVLTKASRALGLERVAAGLLASDHRVAGEARG